MKKYEFLLLVFVVFLFACIKKDPKVDLQSSSWEIVKIKKLGDSDFISSSGAFILNFIDQETYTLKLDVNSCFANYSQSSQGNIALESPGCTKICCDSDFALDVLSLLPKMDKYYFEGATLLLEGQGQMVLIRKE